MVRIFERTASCLSERRQGSQRERETMNEKMWEAQYQKRWSKLCIQIGVWVSMVSPNPVLPKLPAPQANTLPAISKVKLSLTLLIYFYTVPISSAMAAWCDPAEIERIFIICMDLFFLLLLSRSYTRETLKGSDMPAYIIFTCRNKFQHLQSELPDPCNPPYCSHYCTDRQY